MSEDKPSPLQDVRKGLGLLFRAAKSAVQKLPKGGVEEVVVASAREVGRAIENVAATVERGVFGRKRPGSRAPSETHVEGPASSDRVDGKPRDPKS